MTKQMTTTAPPRLALGLGRDKRLLEVRDYVEASRVFARLRDESGLGGSAWPDGRIYDVSGERPRWVARISYNAKVWKGTRYVAGAAPILDPYAAAHEGGAR